MPIFWLARLTIGGGRWLISSPLHSLSIDAAASWPWATAQMMFLGPKAESPPKNTLEMVDCIVLGSTFGIPQRSNSRPMSRSIQGNAFSCPTATSTSSHSTWIAGSPVGTRLRRPLSSYFAATFSKRTPASLLFLWVNSLGQEEVEEGDPFMHGVFFFPGRRLHLLEAAAHDHLAAPAAEAFRRAA